ncbi:hypothetical protein BXZ70DRAFT_1015250 [Cristinia sonorae]|uniref:Uncharacterized protein n=1 Tax=Cristinia sonorae TaxID=1940300 RepID=A0A8K0UYP4_9AGAR|nr:hypothetical protein BXZ70DRAFT_1015250 [Cristinia sonorae]
MPDWTSPAAIARDLAAFRGFQHALTGLYCWEFVISLDFEWSFITGKRRFRWPLIFYFLARYSALATVVTLMVSLNIGTDRPINCTALYTFLSVAGQFAIGFASLNLALRAMALWGQAKRVVIPLSLGICGHWAVLLPVCVVSGHWQEGMGCQLSASPRLWLMLSFLWAICLDFTVFVLCAYKIARPGLEKRSGLIRMVFKDGLMYLFLAMLANIPAAVLTILNLNQFMQLMCNLFAALASTIGANRAVRRLVTYSSEDFFAYTTQVTPTAKDVSGRPLSLHFARTQAKDTSRSLQIQVEMDALTTVEEGSSKYSTSKKSKL